MINLSNLIHWNKKVLDLSLCENLCEYADITCKNKGEVTDKTKSFTRNVLVYKFFKTKQDELYKSIILQQLVPLVQKYKNEFSFIYDLEMDDMNLLMYKPGCYYHPHVDYSAQTPRNLSIILNLNDAYEGGELIFFSPINQDVLEKITLGVGDVCIFPSNFLFPHAISKINKGIRYSVITWLK